MYDRDIVDMAHILDMKLVYVIFRGFADSEIPWFSKLGWDGVSQYKWTNSQWIVYQHGNASEQVF